MCIEVIVCNVSVIFLRHSVSIATYLVVIYVKHHRYPSKFVLTLMAYIKLVQKYGHLKCHFKFKLWR